MELSERKQQILKAIIAEYIRTAEPVSYTHLSLALILSAHGAEIKIVTYGPASDNFLF